MLRWRAGCCGDSNRGSVKEEVTNDGVTRDPPGLLKGRAFWLVTGTVTGMAKLGAGTEDWREKGQESRLSPGSRGERLLCHQHLAGSATQQQEAVGDFGFQGIGAAKGPQRWPEPGMLGCEQRSSSPILPLGRSKAGGATLDVHPLDQAGRRA